MTESSSKIHPTAFKAGIGGLFGLALVMASARTYIRLKKFRRVFLDDALFFTAVVGLVTSVGLLYTAVPHLYESVELSVSNEPPSPAVVEAFIKHIPYFQKILDAWAFFVGAAILSIKFVFMFSFRRLVERMRKMMIWWWCVLTVLVSTIPLWLFQFLIVCPASGSAILEKCVSPNTLRKGVDVSIATIVIDIFTDVLIFSVPLTLLWHVQISFGQKFSIGAVLCLSIFTIITAVCVIPFLPNPVWAAFWSQAEACVGLIMASMSAVRIVFVSGGIRNLNKTNPKQRPNLRRELGFRVPLHGEDLMAINLPAIPVATLPGLGLSSSRTLPYRYRHPSTSQETFLQEDIPELRASHGNPIRQTAAARQEASYTSLV